MLKAFRGVRSKIDSEALTGVKSDECLAAVRPALRRLGFTVEGGKKAPQKISRPVLFGENGRLEVSYEVDGFHEDKKDRA